MSDNRTEHFPDTHSPVGKRPMDREDFNDIANGREAPVEKEETQASKSKTFQKGDDAGELIEWFINQIETHDWQPEGTDWGGGQPGPIDPRSDLKHKYTITITRK
jgi:hypothetical protein